MDDPQDLADFLASDPEIVFAGTYGDNHTAPMTETLDPTARKMREIEQIRPVAANSVYAFLHNNLAKLPDIPKRNAEALLYSAESFETSITEVVFRRPTINPLVLIRYRDFWNKYVN